MFLLCNYKEVPELKQSRNVKRTLEAKTKQKNNIEAKKKIGSKNKKYI
jgi:hypothetical protein